MTFSNGAQGAEHLHKFGFVRLETGRLRDSFDLATTESKKVI